MKQTISFYEFKDSFYKMNRQNQFTYNGLKTLFEYFEEYEDSTDSEIELDVIAICCEYVEYDNLADFQLDYDAEDYPDIESIEYNTTVIKIDNDAFIIQAF